MTGPVPMRVSSVLFGREDLLELGRRRLDQARAGAGGLLFLAGEAGIGKSRLLREIAEEARPAGGTHHPGGRLSRRPGAVGRPAPRPGPRARALAATGRQ